jgi:hypothetical protein
MIEQYDDNDEIFEFNYTKKEKTITTKIHQSESNQDKRKKMVNV